LGSVDFKTAILTESVDEETEGRAFLTAPLPFVASEKRLSDPVPFNTFSVAAVSSDEVEGGREDKNEREDKDEREPDEEREAGCKEASNEPVELELNEWLEGFSKELKSLAAVDSVTPAEG